MCGIICIFSKIQNGKVDQKTCLEIFKEKIKRRGPNWFDVKSYCTENYQFLFAASVLWLQGQHMTKQPLEDNEHIFVYNGDIFGGLPNESTLEEGDTKILFRMMSESSSKSFKLLSKLQGPYSFIFFNKKENRLYFGRDIYGRRSFLIGKHSGEIILTSVAGKKHGYDFIELPSVGTFCWDLQLDQLYILPWKYCNPNFRSKLTEVEMFLNKNITIEGEPENCSYYKFTEPDSHQLCLYEKIKTIQSRNIFETVLSDPKWLDNIITLKNLLENAIEKRIATQPKYCKDCINDANICNHTLTGVLFSGGIDCAILALLADKFTTKGRPIDLINVAFDETNHYQTPDRITGLQTLNELKHLRPERCWRFLEVNVPKDELNSARTQYITDLIYPLKTVLDDSLGCALWFASRGTQELLKTPCRVLLVGMGADELFGGYTRHRAALKRKGWFGLHEGLIEDWQNLPYRNLARDDRVVSDHGKQLRTPYLDENIVQFLLNLNCWEKTLPSQDLPQGIGEKILLRSLGYYLGLKNASTLKKRALQFGSRIANKKENAHDLSARLCS